MYVWDSIQSVFSFIFHLLGVVLTQPAIEKHLRPDWLIHEKVVDEILGDPSCTGDRFEPIHVVKFRTVVPAHDRTHNRIRTEY